MSRSATSQPQAQQLPAAFISSKAVAVRSKALNERQRAFCQNVAEGMSWTNAARKAGYEAAEVTAANLRKDVRVHTYIKELMAKFEKKNDITREKVFAGFMEAIDIGRTISDPHAMIKGWTEIAKMAGYYAPDVKKIEISIAAKRLTGQFEQMSDDDLFKLAETEVIDVVGTEISEASTGDADADDAFRAGGAASAPAKDEEAQVFDDPAG